MALDTVSETMTPMHYHLREIIICTYRQVSVSSSPLAQRCPGPLHPIPGVQPGSGTSPAEAGCSLGLKLSGMSPERCQGSFGHGHPVPSCILCCPASDLSGAVLHPSQHPACLALSHIPPSIPPVWRSPACPHHPGSQPAFCPSGAILPPTQHPAHLTPACIPRSIPPSILPLQWHPASCPASRIPPSIPPIWCYPASQPASRIPASIPPIWHHPASRPASQPASFPSSGVQPAEGRADPSRSAPSPEGSSGSSKHRRGPILGRAPIRTHAGGIPRPAEPGDHGPVLRGSFCGADEGEKG